MVSRSAPSSTKSTASAPRVGLRAVAAPARGDLHEVLAEGLGEARQRPGQHPEPGLLPERQVAGDDVGQRTARHHHVGLVEAGPVGGQPSLRRQAALGRVVAGHRRPLCRNRPRGGASGVDGRAAEPGPAYDAGQPPAGVGGDRVLVRQVASRRRRTPRRARGRTRSASAPTSIRPLWVSPTRSAGRDAPSTAPRRRGRARGPGPRVQTAGRETWIEAMPPQASPKSPCPAPPGACLSSAVLGEWSETTRSMSAGARARPTALAVAGLADRRAALELGAAVRHVLGVEDQVVRAGLDRQVDARRRGRRAGRAAPRRC